jgi:tRNA A-37 threonylcarbamoyl transferase component Bud32/predicted negative regulator of RcsB-dependent stress response
VWAAHDPDLDREIAIKVLRHVNASDALRKRLLREARAMARLKHPNVLTVYEVGSSGDVDFIAMELVDGVSLDRWLLHDPPADDLWRALLAAGRGLAAAHAAGLVHRDFKPHNVLRSRDGRVLVTDFGLARGLGDDSAEPVKEVMAIALDTTLEARTPSRTDSVLDSPLTQTGVMIGTPAYMAPEQFHGAAPDPRTDQFAYCISAWQALTGSRPFNGDSLEELRDAAMRGVDGVVANLSKPVRAVLARGLARDPAARWPDMDALLDALERASKPRRRLWPLVAALVVIAVAVNIYVFTREDEKPAPATCAPASEAFAEAWGDGARAELAKTLQEPALTRVADAFDQFRAKWTASYQDACNTPPSKRTDARLACLRSMRDQTVVMRLVVQQAKQLDGIDVHGALPSLAACNMPNPIAQPEFPTDQRRQAVLGVLARTMTLRGVDDVDAAVQQLVTDAKASGWTPLESMVQVIGGNALLARGEYAKARALFRTATKTAHVRFQALAQLGLLEASTSELENPGDAKELSVLLTYARSAVRAAGNDPILDGSLAQLEAQMKSDASLWGKNRQSYTEAIELVIDARKAYVRGGDLRRAGRAAALHARMLLWKGALDEALFVVRSAQEEATAAGVGQIDALVELRGEIAFAKGEYREAHEHYDRLAPKRTYDEPAKHGRVVDEHGRGVRATVVTWSGTLSGDPLRLYTDPRFDGEIVETAADGTFEYHVGDTAIAEAGTLRSAPEPVRDRLELAVRPMVVEQGIVEGLRAPVDAVVELPTDASTYYVHAAVEKTGGFRVAGVPNATRIVKVIGRTGDGLREIAAVKGHYVWPVGATIEVIVRSKTPDDVAAWILRGNHAPKSGAELASMIGGSADSVNLTFHPVGATATSGARELYRSGDRHAILINNAPGDATVCVMFGPQSVRCEAVPVEDSPDSGQALLFKTDE